jgi:hypothetical protein
MLRENMTILTVLFSLIVVPVVLYTVTESDTVTPHAIDGRFGDWEDVLMFTDDDPSTISNQRVNIVSCAVDQPDGAYLMKFYIETGSQAFNTQPGTVERFFIFIDEDNDADTGYSVMGAGADIFVQAAGTQGAGVLAEYSGWDTSTRDASNINGFNNPLGASVRSRDREMEIGFTSSSEGLLPTAVFIFMSLDAAGNGDTSSSMITLDNQAVDYPSQERQKKPGAGIQIDGIFSDWDDIPSVSDARDTRDNLDIDLRETKLQDEPELGDLFFYLRVDGTAMAGEALPFGSSYFEISEQPGDGDQPPSPSTPAGALSGADRAYMYIDLDNDSMTGYDKGPNGMGAEWWVSITGVNGEVIKTEQKEYRTGGSWRSVSGKPVAECAGAELEARISRPPSLSSVDRDAFRVFYYTQDWKARSDRSDTPHTVILSGGGGGGGDGGEGTRHTLGNASNSYGIVAPYNAAAPTMDGQKDGIWGSVAYDLYDAPGTGALGFTDFRIFTYYEKSDTSTPDLLYVGVEIDADSTSNTGDYCELYFDQKHNGSAFPEEPSNTNIPAAPAAAKEWDGDKRFRRDGKDTTNTFYEMSGGNWGAVNLPKGWRGRADWDGAGDHYWYEFKIPLKGIYDNVGNTLQRAIQLNGSGDISGFMVHAYDAGAQKHYFWPDDYISSATLPSSNNTTKPGNWGDLVIDHPKLMINQVAGYGDGTGTPAYEWVELYNAGENTSLHGMSLCSSTEIVHLGNITLKTGGYVVFHSRTGTTESNANGNNSAPGSQNGVNGAWDIYGNGTSDYWNDTGDYVLLKHDGNACPVDFMDYGESITVPSPDTTGRLNSDLNKGISWTETAGALANFTALKKPLLRIPNGKDTDDSGDWVNASWSGWNYNQGLKNILVPEFSTVIIPLAVPAVILSIGLIRRRKALF